MAMNDLSKQSRTSEEKMIGVPPNGFPPILLRAV